MLKPLAIVLSLIIIVVSGMGVVNPDAFRRMVGRHISGIGPAFGVILLTLGLAHY